MRLYVCERCKDRGCELCEQVKRDTLAPILAAVGDHQTQAQQARDTIELARALPCATAEQYQTCGEFLRQAQQQLKHYETARKRLTKPLLDAKREVDAIFKPITTAMAAVKEALSDKLLNYDRRAAESKRAALAAIEQAHQTGDQQAVQQHASALEAPPPALKGVHTRKRWTYRVVDWTKIPLNFMLPDHVKIQEAIKSGIREMPGLEIYEETMVVARS